MTTSDDGFDEAFRDLLPAVRHVTWRILGDEAAAEDAAAEAFIRALTRWSKVRDLPHRDAWIMRVATNVALDGLRKRRREREAATEHDAGEARLDATDSALRLDVAKALAALPKRQREVVVLRHVVGLSEADAARVLGVSVNSAKTHAARGLAALRQGPLRDHEGGSRAL
jgi:RNA polymerase sigma factor (sigma-70 family)